MHGFKESIKKICIPQLFSNIQKCILSKITQLKDALLKALLVEYCSSGEDVFVNTVIILRNWAAILADLRSEATEEARIAPQFWRQMAKYDRGVRGLQAVFSTNLLVGVLYGFYHKYILLGPFLEFIRNKIFDWL